MKNFFIILFIISFISCASTTPVIEKGELNSDKPVTFPPYSGPKTPLVVIPLGLSERAAKLYPHLLAGSVGLGVHNMLADTLYKTKRFRFVEGQDSILKEAMKMQELSQSGLVDPSTAVKIGKMVGAKKVVYGEVFDYGEGKFEHVAVFKVKTIPTIRVGIQIRLMDIETMEYIPASATSYGTDWGEASRKAIESAVVIFMNDIDKQ